MRRMTTSSGVAACNFFAAMIAMLVAISLSKSAGTAVAVLIIAVTALAAITVNVLVYRKLDGRVGIVKYVCFSHFRGFYGYLPLRCLSLPPHK